MLKLPFCTHPDSAKVDTDFRTKSSFRPVPSLALAALCGFIDSYKTLDYKLKAVDLNIEAYVNPGEPIEKKAYPKLLHDAIKNSDYDVLCLSAMFVFNVKWVEEAVGLSKRYHPGAKIILGGGYPTLFPERCLEKHEVDYVVIGEGESTLLHILNKMNNHKDAEFEGRFPFFGYGERGGGGQRTIKTRPHDEYMDLKYLPSPAWSYLNVEKYFKNSGDLYLPVEATRGCPFRCSFCSTYLSWGFRVRYKPVENIMKEMVETKRRYNVESLHFVDDNLTFSKEWIMDFLGRVITARLPVKLTASNFSVKCLDAEIVDMLVRAGFYNFGIAVETGCAEIQKKTGKNLDFAHIRKMVDIIMAHENVHLHINWMVGFPGESVKQIGETFDLARELGAHSNQFLSVLPYPKTRLFEEARREGLLVFDDEDLEKFDNRKCDYLRSGEWNHDMLQDMIYDINIELNFLRNTLMKTAEGRKQLRAYLEGIVRILPEHVIANIMVGYLYGAEDGRLREKYYRTAGKLLKKPQLRKAFKRYLSWNDNAIKDFNEFTKNEDAN